MFPVQNSFLVTGDASLAAATEKDISPAAGNAQFVDSLIIAV
jgi:hypothetical protein